MNDPEWAAFSLELEHGFRGTFGPSHAEDTAGLAQEATYRRHLGDLEYVVATAAIALLVDEGKVFLPEPGEVKSAAWRILRRAAPPFAEAWSVIAEELQRHRETPALVAAVADRLGEGPARWCAARGRAALAAEPVHGTGFMEPRGGAVLRRLEGEYDVFVEQADEDERVGLALERAGARAELGRAHGPRKLAALEVLGLPAGGGDDGR